MFSQRTAKIIFFFRNARQKKPVVAERCHLHCLWPSVAICIVCGRGLPSRQLTAARSDQMILRKWWIYNGGEKVTIYTALETFSE